MILRTTLPRYNNSRQQRRPKSKRPLLHYLVTSIKGGNTMLNCFTVHLALIPCLLSLARAFPIYQPDPYSYKYFNPEENLGVNIFLTEGDILVDRRRDVDFQYYKTWYNRSIPYEFDPNFEVEEKKLVKAAMFDIQNVSCLSFRPRLNEKDYIKFTIPETGCYSPVGRTGGAQIIGLGGGCFIHGIIQHEILHALGLWHEQNRLDRDEYIKVMWDNIPKEHETNFRVSNSHELFLSFPYDYGSVMHYSNNTFAIDRRKPTLDPIKELPSGVVMGQRVGLSQGDVDKLNALYRCDIHNCSDPGHLENGGVIGSDFSVGSRVHYFCNSGYMLFGAFERVCRDLGEWSGEAPACLLSDQHAATHYCNFDNATSPYCGWTLSTDDNLNWLAISGPTPSEDTGPSLDHTLSTVYGRYAYVEATNIPPNSKARLVSPTFNFGSDRACIVMFTNMYGAHMGNLTVYLTQPGNHILGQEDEVISIQGDQGEQWQQLFLMLENHSSSFTITIEGSTGHGYKSDIAIDDIVVGRCSDFTPLALAGGLLETVDCSFNQGLCDFVQDRADDIDWDFNIGKTATFDTGPDCDPHDCVNGQYLYIESSKPRVMGDRARLKTRVIGGEGRHCLTFYYHMYGEHIGQLSVKLVSVLTGQVQTLWAASGDRGNQWHAQQVDFQAEQAYELWFDGTVGASYRGDIAIDSISVATGICAAIPQFDCSFEHDLCGWVNAPAPGDTLDWTRHTGETDSPDTGPTEDRENPGGYYLYVESSRTIIGDLARLVSPTVTGVTAGGHCLRFWYHMFGSSSGNLTVSTQTDSGQEQVLWQELGDQGNQWQPGVINVTSTGGSNFKVIFEAAMAGFTGDVAIDDVSIQNSLCGS